MDARSSLPRITLFLSVSLAFVALTQLAPGERRVAEHAPLSPTRVEHLLEQDDADARFDGTIHGWRVGPSASLAREGLYEPPGNVPCKTRSRFLDPTRPTSLDLTIRPEPTAVVGSRSRKVGCADGTNFALVEYELKTRLGPGSLTIERRRVSKKAWSAFAGHRKVQAATIKDRPAIAIHPLDDRSGFGQSELIIIEDTTFDPLGTVVHLVADSLPFAEVLRIAEGVELL